MDGNKEEIQGQLLSVSYNTSSHGMMAGTSSFGGERLDWKKDGSVILTSTNNGGGKSIHLEYRVDPEFAEKVREYVNEKRLAQLSKEDIPLPLVYDCFTSVTINMEYGDLNGNPWDREHYNLNCGAAGMTFGEIERTLCGLIRACRESGECIVSEMKEQPNGIVGMMGLGFAMMGMTAEQWECPVCGKKENTGAFCMGCAAPRPAAASGAPVPTETQEPEPKKLPEPEPGCWTCKCCGFNQNQGKFCAECGSRRED
ncbi:MAG: hypothetical protein J5643_10530 [Lachnospiraceae bacterium]|nr:hypothetical protein [Lachnospiraceae bacterium]